MAIFVGRMPFLSQSSWTNKLVHFKIIKWSLSLGSFIQILERDKGPIGRKIWPSL